MVALTFDHGLEPYYRRELLSRFADADAVTRARGRRWYPAARERMATLAERTGYSLEQAVAVMAITSPGAQVSTNLEWTERALTSHGRDKVGRFPNRQGEKIRAVLADADLAADYVTGPKVAPFFRAILGENELVLDRWALFAAQSFGDVHREALTDVVSVKSRAAIVAAYKRAARIAGMRVRNFQAAVWIQTRESTPVLKRGHYVVPRLADITAA